MVVMAVGTGTGAGDRDLDEVPNVLQIRDRPPDRPHDDCA